MRSTIEHTIIHAKFLSKHLNRSKIDYGITAVLLELGVSTGRAGFLHLKRAIWLHYHDPSRQATKGLYPTVGSMANPVASGQQVEQAIRFVIAKAWRHRDEAVWMRFFPLNDDGFVEKPTSLDFITHITQFLELWQGCYQEVGYETIQ